MVLAVVRLPPRPSFLIQALKVTFFSVAVVATTLFAVGLAVVVLFIASVVLALDWLRDKWRGR